MTFLTNGAGGKTSQLEQRLIEKHIKDLSIKRKSVKLSEQNRGNLWNLGLGWHLRETIKA